MSKYKQIVDCKV